VTQQIAKPASAVASSATQSPTGRPPQGTRGVAIPLGEPALPLKPGDRVDVVGIAPNVEVLQVAEKAAVVAIPEAQVSAVVAALQKRTAALALL
jgi:hypothetical protein